MRVQPTEEGGRKIVGYAAVFNRRSQDLGGFVEVIRPGAFTEAIQTDDVRGLWNHDANFVLGRNKSGTLRLVEDDIGLRYEIDAPDTQTIRDLVMAPMERGDVDQSSFGFMTVSDEWRHEDGQLVRELIKCGLFDVSPVTYPAYLDTKSAVRSAEAAGFDLTKPPGTPPAPEPEPQNEPPGYSVDLARRRLRLLELSRHDQ